MYELGKEEYKYYPVVYLGFLPNNTYEYHERFAGISTYDYPYSNMIEDRHSYIINAMRENGLLSPKRITKKGKAKKAKSDIENGSDSPSNKKGPPMMTILPRNRPFLGMDYEFSKNIQFNSIFEGGNIDVVIQITQSEFDLYMKVDSNSRGHTNW